MMPMADFWSDPAVLLPFSLPMVPPDVRECG